MCENTGEYTMYIYISSKVERRIYAYNVVYFNVYTGIFHAYTLLYSTKEEVVSLESIKAKLAAWTKNKAHVKAAAIVFGIVLILIIGLCITIHMHSNIQKKYSSAVEQMQEQTYQNLISMTELFARIDDPTVDVRYKLIPELKAQYTAAAAVNSVLTNACGEKKAVLSAEQIAAFDAAFEAFATAYRTDSATGLAQADMGACIEEVQAMITARYTPVVDEKDKVVVIDASSGEVHKENPK